MGEEVMPLPAEARKGIGCPGAGVISGCELPVGVLGTELGSSAGAVSAPTHWVISPVPEVTFYLKQNRQTQEDLPSCVWAWPECRDEVRLHPAHLGEGFP